MKNTWILAADQSRARTFELHTADRTLHHVEELDTPNGRGACAEMEPLLMIRPPRGVWAFMMRIASCVHRNDPLRLVSTTRCHCSSVSSYIGTAGAPMPALLNNRSSRPNRAMVCSNSTRTDVCSDGSLFSIGSR